MNGADHIEIYSSTKDEDIISVYKDINDIDDFLDGKVEYAFRERTSDILLPICVAEMLLWHKLICIYRLLHVSVMNLW